MFPVKWAKTESGTIVSGDVLTAAPVEVERRPGLASIIHQVARPIAGDWGGRRGAATGSRRSFGEYGIGRRVGRLRPLTGPPPVLT